MSPARALHGLLTNLKTKQLAKMNSYKDSSGQWHKKIEIDRKIRDAKKDKVQSQLDEYGYNFCETCKKGGILDCSHIISVDDCQKSGRSEIAYDVRNIEILCRECHENHHLKSKQEKEQLYKSKLL